MISDAWKEALDFEIESGTRLMVEAGRKNPALTKQIAYQVGELSKLKRKWAADQGARDDFQTMGEAVRALSEVSMKLWYTDFKAAHPDLAARWERMDTEDAS